MLRFGKERLRKAPLAPVDDLLSRVEAFGYYRDDYLRRVHTYLRYARECGLSSQAIADSCIDLAETYSQVNEVIAMRQDKQRAWDEARKVALSVDRKPIDIDMELDPVYFEAILRGIKRYEGRAYKPDSSKNYPDIRRKDRIHFHLSGRKEEFSDEAVNRGLSLTMELVCTVGDVHFAPTVHGVYQIPRFNGLGFQPMVDERDGNASLQLERAAVYHTFPGYHELIEAHGFLGIQVEQPQLATAF
jgi:hypothetical protein